MGESWLKSMYNITRQGRPSNSNNNTPVKDKNDAIQGYQVRRPTLIMARTFSREAKSTPTNRFIR